MVQIEDTQYLKIVVSNDFHPNTAKREGGNNIAIQVIKDRLSLYKKNDRIGRFEIEYRDYKAIANIWIPI